MDSDSEELSLDSPENSNHEGSASSGDPSSGFASDGFRSGSFGSSESEGRELSAPIRRRRAPWRPVHHMQIESSTRSNSQLVLQYSTSQSSDLTDMHSERNLTAVTPGLISTFPNAIDNIWEPSGQTSRSGSDVSIFSQQLRDFLFNVHGIVGWKDLAKEQEVRNLSDLLEIVETGGLSEQRIRSLLKTRRVRSHFSYDVLMNYLYRRSKVPKYYSLMCPLEHMTRRGPTAEGSVCATEECELKVVESHKFWFRYVSDMIAALCREQNSFTEIMNGCRRARRAVSEGQLDTLYDYYDGALFRRKYAGYLRNWNEDVELFAFLTFSSDGFEEICGHRGPRTAWPLIFIVLNFDPNQRFKAGNAILSGFIPGTHDSTSFDTFLEPIVTDLAMLEKGCFVTCADGKRRKLRVFVLFVTADYPAASKLLGFMGHTASFPCRYCHKRQTYVPEIRSRALIPSGIIPQRLYAMSSRGVNDFEWLDSECGEPRTNRETRDTWRELDSFQKCRENRIPTAMKKVRTLTGISRRPVLGRLRLDFVHSLPYDPMHLLFLGWVKHLLRLLFGIHEKITVESTFVISETQRVRMNESLRDGARGIPGCWGRASESLEHISNFKAEDFKNFGMFYGPILFSGHGVPQKISRLWGVTSNIVHIACDPSPTLRDVENLRKLLQQGHTLFASCFYVDANHAFCFTPNTHAILHLAEMLRECGPLPNVSQFVVERIIGVIGEMIGSMSKPEANLFHKTHTMFSYRLLSGGMTKLEDATRYQDSSIPREHVSGNEIGEEEDISSGGFDHTVLGSGIKANNNAKKRKALEWVEKRVGSSMHVEVLSVWCHGRAKTAAVEPVVFETEINFRMRERRAGYTARQKYWIAGLFCEQSNGLSEASRITGSTDRPNKEVYYGRVVEIWNVTALITSTENLTSIERSYILITVDWQYGISIDSFTGMMFVRNGKRPRRGSLRHVERTIEEIGCVNRLIGFFDHQGRRYFLDSQRWRLLNSSSVLLKGTL